MDEGLLEDLLPSNWNVRCRQSTGKTPGKFVESLLQWLCAAEQAGNCPTRVSDLEIVFVLLGDPSFMFPFQMDGSTAWTLQRLDALFQTPALGMLLRPTQDALQQLSLLFPEVIQRLPPQPAIELGVYKKFGGLSLGC